MNFKLILGVVLLLVALIFSVQNAAAVDLKFLGWHFSMSLAFVIFGALGAGLIGGWAITSALQQGKSRSSPALLRRALDLPADRRGVGQATENHRRKPQHRHHQGTHRSRH